jgi:hypothetical protein
MRLRYGVGVASVPVAAAETRKLSLAGASAGVELAVDGVLLAALSFAGALTMSALLS